MFYPLLLCCLASLLAVSDCLHFSQRDVDCSKIRRCLDELEIFETDDFRRLWKFADGKYYDKYCGNNDKAQACVKKFNHLKNDCKNDMVFVTTHLNVSSFLCSNYEGKNAVKKLPKSICANNELARCLYNYASSACTGKEDKAFSSCIADPLGKVCGNEIIYIMNRINEINREN
ncbi:uncharacterized protein LOC106075000 [Biomphalaria glabrata]|uniref:Uncharacterized protein LOC106075000 n=1 Tax=Biomphalaria glabrata TaxID=6526 RepID=A0A9W3BFI9_BIOGL|nr:uncharacterized protein LOC106075000 [Biomphalaria glabrata]XP_055898208.1 uncharacterized protein LOC106075000 [Biomphalaria glabrata]